MTSYSGSFGMAARYCRSQCRTSGLPALFVSIKHVRILIAQKKMLRVYTTGIIAAMADKISASQRHAIMQFVRDAMGKYRALAIRQFQPAVRQINLLVIPDPKPATGIGLGDVLGVKPVSQCAVAFAQCRPI